MSCAVAAGRTVGCKDAISGIRGIWIVDSVDVTTQVGYLNSAGLITAWATTPVTVYKYGVRRETSKLDITIHSDPVNGTTYFEQRLSLQFNKLSKADSDLVKILAYGTQTIIVQDNQNNLMVLGARNGMNMDSSTITTGQAMGDQSGFMLNFVGKEIDEVLWITPGSDATDTTYPFDIVTGITPS